MRGSKAKKLRKIAVKVAQDLLNRSPKYGVTISVRKVYKRVKHDYNKFNQQKRSLV